MELKGLAPANLRPLMSEFALVGHMAHLGISLRALKLKRRRKCQLKGESMRRLRPLPPLMCLATDVFSIYLAMPHVPQNVRGYTV